MERKFTRQVNDAKILSDNTLETVKKTFYSEIQALKVPFKLFNSFGNKKNRKTKRKWRK